MHPARTESDWHYFKGKLVERWPALEEEDLELLREAPDVLVGRLQEHYGMTHEEAAHEAESFHEELEGSHATAHCDQKGVYEKL